MGLAAGAIPIGRIGQGLNLGNAPVIGVEAATNAATGGKLGMAKAAMSAAAPAAGAIAQGAGLRVGWTIGGIFNLLLNAAKNMVPEFGSDAGYIGVYVWLIVIVYWMSWVAGFATSAVLRSHAILALIGFIIFLLIKGLSFQSFRYYGVVFSVIMIIDYVLLTGTVQWYLVIIAALLLAFREGNPVEDAKRVLLVMTIASVGYYAFNKFSHLLVLPFFAKLSLPLNFDNFLFFTAVLANRTVTFPFLWYAIFGLNKETRVARSLAWFVMLLLIFGFWPQISPEVNKIRGQYASGVTAEQKATVPNFIRTAAANFGKVGASLGTLISAKRVEAYEGFERTFGFGEPKEEPKLGLQLSQNSQMPKKVPDYKPPEPNFVMSVPNPFPADSKNPYIEVTEIKCKENSGKKLTFKKAITDEGVTVTDLSGPAPKSQPVEVYYSGPRGGNEVKCLFEGWQSGEDYNVGAEVTYKVENSAYLSTTFMRSDTLKGFRRNPNDPKNKAILDAIPPADAEYRNVPVTLTWGPRVLPNAPVPIDLDRESNNLAITVYVAKNSVWENAEIKAVTQLGLLLPKGVALVLGDSCDFVPSDADSGDGRKWYIVDTIRITKDGKPRFIGDAIRFDCGMTVTDAALGKTDISEGTDTAAARFDVSGSFEVTTKLEGITFTFGDGEGSGTPTQQQLQEKCTATGGTWKAATATAAATCDCRTGKELDATKGCIASSPSPTPASASTTPPPPPPLSQVS